MTPRTIQIRQYQESDREAVIDLWNESSPGQAPHIDPATAIRKKWEVQRELFFVAEFDGAVVGTAMGGYDGHRGWVYAVAVKPQFRRQGIGGALVQSCRSGISRFGMSKNQFAGVCVERRGRRVLPKARLQR